VRCDLLDYDLPPERIAKRPAPERDGARMLVGASGGIEHDVIRSLPARVEPGSLIVVNDTRVMPARLYGRRRPTGGKVELLLVRCVDPQLEGWPHAERWLAVGRASKSLRAGTEIDIEGELLTVQVLESESPGDGPELNLRLEPVEGHTVLTAIEACGHVPLPPYIGRPDEAVDRERYQTVFARAPGAVAAPTAGLHISEALLGELRARAEVCAVTLHVGLGTFKPVVVDDLSDHSMHEEVFEVPHETATAIAAARARGAPILAIGTTVVRALESAADDDGLVSASRGSTDLLIQPGYRFKVVNQLLTNFHLPRSTLLALVFAFHGRERVLEAYGAAIADGYRFFSYGDAMLLDRIAPRAEDER